MNLCDVVPPVEVSQGEVSSRKVILPALTEKNKKKQDSAVREKASQKCNVE